MLLAKREAYLDVFKNLWLTGMAFGLLGMVIAPFGKEFASKMNSTVEVDLDKVGKRHRRANDDEKL